MYCTASPVYSDTFMKQVGSCYYFCKQSFPHHPVFILGIWKLINIRWTALGGYFRDIYVHVSVTWLKDANRSVLKTSLWLRSLSFFHGCYKSLTAEPPKNDAFLIDPSLEQAGAKKKPKTTIPNVFIIRMISNQSLNKPEMFRAAK